MNFGKIEHIGIAVRNLDEAKTRYMQLLGVSPYKQEEVEREGVITLFYLVGETKIELLAATRPDSAIAKFIEKKGEGIHHIAYHVENIREMMQNLKAQGFEFIYDEPKEGADNKWITFIHPKSCNGVLTELCQETTS
jgi:methylmalonyl-CoA/ethylmalonyl-CoA epimerase